MTHGKHHLAIEKRNWERGDLSRDHNTAWLNLEIMDIEPTWERFSELVGKIKTGLEWSKLDAYQRDQMEPVLADPETRLLLLIKNKKPVGYSLITGTPTELKNRFWASTADKRVVTIENLALFEGERGNGIGKKFFDKIFADLFKDYDTIYWGTSDFNDKGLVPFYTDRMGMSILAYDPPSQKERPKVA